jgi:exonuclease SbcC
MRWEGYEEAAKEKIKEIESEITALKMRIEEIEDEIRNEPKLKADVAEAERQQQEAQAALDLAEAALELVKHAPAERNNALRRQEEINQRLRGFDGDLKSAAEEIVRQERRVAAYERTIATQDEIQAGYAALEEARDTNQALADKLMQLSDLDEQRHGFERQLDAARAELRTEISGYEATIAQLEKTVKAAQPEALDEVRIEIAALEALEAERSSLQEQIVTLQGEKGERDATNKTLRGEMDELKDRINRLSAVEGAACPLCGQPLDEKHRVNLLDELQAIGTTRGDTFRANQARMKAIADETKAKNDAIVDIRVKLQRLADLQKREGELKSGVKKAQDAELQLGEVRARLDGASETLQGEAFAPELRTQITTVDAQRSALGYDSDRHSAARQGLETFREFEARQKELEIALEALPDSKLALEGAQARQERLLRAQAEEREHLEILAVEIAKLEVLVREEQVRREEVRHQRLAYDGAYRKLVNAQQALKAIEDGRVRKVELEARLAQSRVQRAIYEELKLAFGKNGIPAMIIETAIPELEAGANRLLNRMTDGRMSVMLNTQREKITGGVAETLDIQIADELGTRAYEMFSGGEAFRINFALRVALSQMLARRAGAQLRTLFIDEGFGTQDEEGRNKLVEAITAIQEDFDLILVITHIEDLRDSFPVHVMIEKTSDGSRISVR